MCTKAEADYVSISFSQAYLCRIEFGKKLGSAFAHLVGVKYRLGVASVLDETSIVHRNNVVFPNMEKGLNSQVGSGNVNHVTKFGFGVQ